MNLMMNLYQPFVIVICLSAQIETQLICEDNGSQQAATPSSQNMNHTPWSCSETFQWRDLGENIYPRHVLEVKCIPERPCFYEFYRCKPQYMSIRVLKRKTDGCTDPLVPQVLRPTWRFSKVQITRGCYCSR